MADSIPQGTVVLVADGGKATLYRSRGAGNEISLSQERQMSPKDLADDGPSGSRPEDQTPQQTDEATFAKQLAKALSAMKQSGAFEHLVLIADPQTLGQIRDAMDKSVGSSIVRSLSKDLTNHSAQDIAAALSK